MTTSSELNPSARVTWLESPAASPGQCGMCGKPSHKDGFADPRLDYEFYGSLVFCRDCAGDLASVFGYLAPETYGEMQKEVESLKEETQTLRAAILGLESAVESLTDYRDLRGRNASDQYIDPGVSVSEIVAEEPATPEQDVPESDGILTESSDAGTAEDVELNEPADEQGRDDVRDTSIDVNALLDL